MVLTEADILAKLRNARLDVISIYHLVNTETPYPAAIPILIEALSAGVGNSIFKEGVIRALAVKEARGVVAAKLLEAFESPENSEEFLKWAIGNTFEVVATPKEISMLLD